MKNKKITHVTLALFLFCCSCSNDNLEEYVNVPDSKDPVIEQPDEEVIEVDKLPEYTQRSGNPNVGYEYLISGDYMSSGIPYDAFLRGFGADNSNELGRTGDNAVISYDYTAVNASNGVRVVAPNCLQCHAGKINDDLIVGLGNHAADFTMNRADDIGLLNTAISFLYGGQTSEEWLAYDQFRKSIVAIGPKTITETVGVNPADKITQVLVSHRDKNTLEWSDEPYVTVDDEVIPTDVPAWWLLKKKNAMFYHAIGRADFSKSFIGSSLLTLLNKDKAEELNEKMVDVLAYINSLEPPQFPYSIDSNLSEQGKTIFEANCASCHGTYDTNATYPNFIVSLKTIGTDPELSNHYSTSSTVNNYFLDWFNSGWFGSGENALEIVADGGYIAPPLDGVWATAPYFHNGSVPTLEDVLNSKQRPSIWSRTFDSSDYDQIKLGWNYTVETSKSGIDTYDTSLKGYGNGGHTFGDDLTDSERKALLEYLKTL